MNTQRITVSLPSYLYDQLMVTYNRGEISRFISEATEKLLITRKIEGKTDPVKEFLSLRKRLKLPTFTQKRIKKAINKGRA